MAAKIRTIDGREFTLALSGKRAAEALGSHDGDGLVRLVTMAQAKIWIAPEHVVMIEDRPDLD